VRWLGLGARGDEGVKAQPANPSRIHDVKEKIDNPHEQRFDGDCPLIGDGEAAED
jgi:hypothetical protein